MRKIRKINPCRDKLQVGEINKHLPQGLAGSRLVFMAKFSSPAHSIILK